MTLTITATDGVDAGDLLDREDVGKDVKSRSAVFGRDEHAEKTELSEFPDDIPWKRVGRLALGDSGAISRLGELHAPTRRRCADPPWARISRGSASAGAGRRAVPPGPAPPPPPSASAPERRQRPAAPATGAPAAPASPGAGEVPGGDPAGTARGLGWPDLLTRFAAPGRPPACGGRADLPGPGETPSRRSRPSGGGCGFPREAAASACAAPACRPTPPQVAEGDVDDRAVGAALQVVEKALPDVGLRRSRRWTGIRSAS